MSSLFVFDTNGLVSASLIGGTTTAKALDRAIILGKLTFSNATMDEFIEVLFRKKFDRYFLNDEEKWRTIGRITLNAEFFFTKETITACRDPKDNKFLELAVAAKASCIITGDSDLLILHPFREIPIVNASDFLEMKF
ncbi:MAG TPA: putative toxin-antitoxin system toxin component, PIN family [Ginsengibacter sp.]|nr:putative toxin-antitoxin system toxin component, PIN family [Ginsengibacter sp.]HRP16577.1 putative toxin-antitoxin system toxin component, PIN family [Ginsengibacter sp.]